MGIITSTGNSYWVYRDIGYREYIIGNDSNILFPLTQIIPTNILSGGTGRYLCELSSRKVRLNEYREVYNFSIQISDENEKCKEGWYNNFLLQWNAGGRYDINYIGWRNDNMAGEQILYQTNRIDNRTYLKLISFIVDINIK